MQLLLFISELLSRLCLFAIEADSLLMLGWNVHSSASLDSHIIYYFWTLVADLLYRSVTLIPLLLFCLLLLLSAVTWIAESNEESWGLLYDSSVILESVMLTF